MTCAACGQPVEPADYPACSYWLDPQDHWCVAHNACLRAYDEIAEAVAR